MLLQLLARREGVPIKWSWGHCKAQRVKLTRPEAASVHCRSHLGNGVMNKSCPSLFSLRDFLCLIVNFSSSSYFPFSLCQWSAAALVSLKVLGLRFPLEKTKTKTVLMTVCSHCTLELVTLWSLLTSNLLRFTIFCVWYTLQKPTPGREGPVASLLHCGRATLAFQSIYYGIKWIPLGLIPCCNCNEKKQFLTLHLRSITIKIH